MFIFVLCSPTPFRLHGAPLRFYIIFASINLNVPRTAKRGGANFNEYVLVVFVWYCSDLFWAKFRLIYLVIQVVIRPTSEWLPCVSKIAYYYSLFWLHPVKIFTPTSLLFTPVPRLCCFPQSPPSADWLAALLGGSYSDAPQFLPPTPSFRRVLAVDDGGYLTYNVYSVILIVS